MRKNNIWMIATLTCVLTFSLFSEPVFAIAGYYACYYDGSNRCESVRDEYGPEYEGFGSYAACDTYCPY